MKESEVTDYLKEENGKIVTLVRDVFYDEIAPIDKSTIERLCLNLARITIDIWNTARGAGIDELAKAIKEMPMDIPYAT